MMFFHQIAYSNFCFALIYLLLSLIGFQLGVLIYVFQINRKLRHRIKHMNKHISLALNILQKPLG